MPVYCNAAHVNVCNEVKLLLILLLCQLSYAGASLYPLLLTNALLLPLLSFLSSKGDLIHFCRGSAMLTVLFAVATC